MSNLQSLSNSTQVQSGSASFVVQTSEVPPPTVGVRHLSFEGGVNGERAVSGSSVDYDSGGTYTEYSNTHVYTGTMAAKIRGVEGSTATNNFGGAIGGIPKMYKGEQYWHRAAMYMPANFDYNAPNAIDGLKMFRMQTRDANGTHVGFLDALIKSPDNSKAITLAFEGNDGTNDIRSVAVGDVNDKPDKDKLFTYELNVVLDNISVDDGGQGRFRFWKNGKLVADVTNMRTLAGSKHYASSTAYNFTYWNGGAPTSNYMWIDDIMIQYNGTPGQTDSQGNPMIGV